jgi:hypothetical protein
MTSPPPIPSSPDRLRYLAAMGIDVWIRRGPGDPAAAAAGEVPTRDGPTSMQAEFAGQSPEDSPAGGAADPAQGDAAASGREEGVRALLDAVDDSAALPPGPAGQADSGVSPPDPDAEAAAISSVEPDAPAPVPRFRLRILGLGAGMLLVDEAALEAAPAAALQRLGDLLRAGCLLRQAATGAKVESQTFFWPQLDVADVDQSLPRAVEALSAFVRRRSEGAGFFLILVEPATGLLDHDAGEPLRALDVLPVLRARIDSGFIEDPGPEADRAAWASLLRMVGAAVHDEVRRDD